VLYNTVLVDRCEFTVANPIYVSALILAANYARLCLTVFAENRRGSRPDTGRLHFLT